MRTAKSEAEGGVLLEGTELEVTGIADHSRLCVAAGLVERATSKAGCELLTAALRRHGIPDEILTATNQTATAMPISMRRPGTVLSR